VYTALRIADLTIGRGIVEYDFAMRRAAGIALVGAAGVVSVSLQLQDLPFSPSVTAGGLVYVSGTIASDRTADVRGQARQALEQIERTLAGSGLSMRDAVSVTVYLKRAEDFPALNEVYRTFVGDAPPVRTTVVADLMVPDGLVEISVVAAAKGTPRRVILPDGWLRSPSPYSYAVEAGDTVFLSGLVARNARDNTFAGGDMTAQSRAVLENARALLTAAGLGFEHVVSARAFITDVSARDAMNAVYRSYFPKDPPARATVVTRLMQPDYLVEMTFVATRAPKQVVAGEGDPNPNLSAAIRAGSRLYLSGMLGTTSGNAGDVGAQTRETLRRLGAVLTRAGFSWADVVDSLVYLADTNGFTDMNAAYRSVLPAPYPARATVQAGLLNPHGKVEIMMTAVKR
jgi:enamine deaminase RidA (YjgF/YER057c/UK114 family)